MDSFAYIYVLGVGLVAVLALSGHFGFGYGTGPLGFNYTRFVVFALLWFIALPLWLISRLTGHRHG